MSILLLCLAMIGAAGFALYRLLQPTPEPSSVPVKNTKPKRTKSKTRREGLVSSDKSSSRRRSKRRSNASVETAASITVSDFDSATTHPSSKQTSHLPPTTPKGVFRKSKSSTDLASDTTCGSAITSTLKRRTLRRTKSDSVKSAGLTRRSLVSPDTATGTDSASESSKQLGLRTKSHFAKRPAARPRRALAPSDSSSHRSKTPETKPKRNSLSQNDPDVRARAVQEHISAVDGIIAELRYLSDPQIIMEEMETSKFMKIQKVELQDEYKQAMEQREFDRAGELHKRIMAMQNVENRVQQSATKVKALISTCEALAVPLRCEADRCAREFIFASAATLENYATQVDSMLRTLHSRPEMMLIDAQS
eukprot:TRINITY_DN12670_c13_g1_i1.p1 TRINITY_DN12670_c13_g1~~TRINITY_DN12670_c13_g1_i1.p1  ORF type:complete len:365 (+),score=40.28 TRINITY_DN12670_c13_g1_i1:82-1176(+)